LKGQYNSWETTTRSSYVDPRVRKQPVQPPTGETTAQQGK